MRALTLSLASVLAISALAASAQAQSISPPASMRDVDQMGQPADRFGFIMANQVTRQVERARLARKAAKLVNAGHCDQAESLARASNDTAMAHRIVAVCMGAS
ncbi:MAG TPA: hypothetical protein VN113_09285 [Caulobacter sp.]|nr:hypothetical protein [Caulobacter sp.]